MPLIRYITRVLDRPRPGWQHVGDAGLACAAGAAMIGGSLFGVVGAFVCAIIGGCFGAGLSWHWYYHGGQERRRQARTKQADLAQDSSH